MGAFKQLKIHMEEICGNCQGFNENPLRCLDCKMSVKMNGKDILINGMTGDIIDVKEGYTDEELEEMNEEYQRAKQERGER
jgi:hypothetical protein